MNTTTLRERLARVICIPNNPRPGEDGHTACCGECAIMLERADAVLAELRKEQAP